MTDGERSKLKQVLHLLLDVIGTAPEPVILPTLAVEEDPWWDAPTVARRFSVSLSYVYRATRSGKLVGHRLGSTWRYRPSDVEAFIRANEREPNP